MNQSATFKELSHRVSIMENNNRKLAIVVCILCAMLFTILITGAANAIDSIHHEKIITEHLQIVDNQGNVIIEMQDDDIFGPLVKIKNSEGHVAIELDANSAGFGGSVRTYYQDGVLAGEFGNVRGWGSGYTIYDLAGNLRVQHTIYGEGWPSLKFFIGEGDDVAPVVEFAIMDDSPFITIYTDEDYVSFPLEDLISGSKSGGAKGRDETTQTRCLEITDENGNVRARLDVDPEEGPGLALFNSSGILRQRTWIAWDENPRSAYFDEDENLRALIGVSYDGAAVKLFNEDEIMRCIMGLYMDGSTGVVLLDENDEVRLGMGVREDGDPSFEMFDHNGASEFHAP